MQAEALLRESNRDIAKLNIEMAQIDDTEEETIVFTNDAKLDGDSDQDDDKTEYHSNQSDFC